MNKPNWQRIYDINTGREIASTFFTDMISNRWTWVQDVVSRKYDCLPDEVDEIETDEGDVITANGKPVAMLNERPGSFCMMTATMAEAAE